MFLDQLYDKFSSTLTNTIAPTVKGITDVIMPMFLGGIALHIVWIAYKIIQEQEVIMSEVVKTIGWLSLASFFIGTTDAYMTYVVPFFTELPESLAKGITSNNSDSINLVSQFWNAFDPVFNSLEAIAKTYGKFAILKWIKYGTTKLILSATQFLITFTVTLNLLICKFMLSLALCLGTLFFALGCFPPTRNYLNLWIGQVFNYSLLCIIYVLSAKVMCMYIQNKILNIVVDKEEGIGSVGWEIFVLSLILTAILGKISGLASGLAGGMGMTTVGGIGSAAGAMGFGTGAMAKKALGGAVATTKWAGRKIANSKTFKAIKSIFGGAKGGGR